MDQGSAGPTPADIIDEILSQEGYEVRVRRLDRRQEDFDPALVDEFRKRASAELRRDPVEASSRARLAVHVARALGDDDATAACLRVQAQAAILGGRHQEALRVLEEASDALPVDATDLARAELDGTRVQALASLDRYEEARETGRHALETFEEHGNRAGAIRVRTALADLAFRLDRPREALRHYARAEALLTEDAPRGLRGSLAGNRANALEACNRLRAARRQFALAREHFVAVGADHAVAQVEYNTAYAEMLQGRYEDALRRYARAEEEFRRLGDDRHLAHIELDRAEVHLHLNLPDDVKEMAGVARTKFSALGLEKEAAQALLLAGRAAEIAGESDAALRLFREAGATFARLGLVEREFSCLVQCAGLAEGAGDLEEAEMLTDRAAKRLGKGMNPLSSASLRLLRARIDLARARPEAALAAADRVSRDCRRIHAPWVRIEASRIAGAAHRSAGRPDEAILAYRDAIDELETYRGGVPPDEYMAAFLAGRSELYGEIVDLLVSRSDPELAFEFAERAKSRALIDLLASGRPSGPGRAGVERASRRLRYLRERLTALYQRMNRDDEGGDERAMRSAERVRHEATRLEKQIAGLLRNLRLHDREASSLEAVDAVDLASVRESLEPDTALVEYFLTPDRLTTFLVTREAVHVVSQDVREADLRSRLERFQFHIAEQQRSVIGIEKLTLASTRANLSRLADVLIGPIAGRLSATRLVVVPHGILHQLPFHALPWGEGWMADRFEVVHAPSAAVYGYCGGRRPGATGRAAIFGLPDDVAPRIEEEARLVARRLRSGRVFLREEATFAALAGVARDARILHIATHGMFRPAQPMLSAIHLADGWKNLYDLYDLDVRGELVVLAACESGTARVTDGDEILGLTRAFLFAGAPALLTSQWRVDDAATTSLMDAFYRHLRTTRDAAAAHQAAMREVRASLPHPYYWAPFVLTGRPVITRRFEGADRPRVEPALQRTAT